MSAPEKVARPGKGELVGEAVDVSTPPAASITRSPNGKSRPKSRPFFKVECEAVKQELRHLSPYETQVLLLMQAYRGQDGEAFPEVRTIAETSALANSTAHKMLRSLCHKHWLKKMPPGWKGRKSTTYLVREFSASGARTAPKAHVRSASDNGTSHAERAANGKKAASRQVVLESTSVPSGGTTSGGTVSFEAWVHYATAKGKNNPQAYARKAIKEGWPLPKSAVGEYLSEAQLRAMWPWPEKDEDAPAEFPYTAEQLAWFEQTVAR